MTSYEPQTHHQELLHRYLARIVEMGGSDLHLREDEPPFLRHNGHLMAMPEAPALDRETLAGIVGVLASRRPKLIPEFEDAGEADLSYELEGVARYRVNVFKERGRLALTLRVIPAEVPQIDNIGVPPILKQLALEHHGLVLVTGATGSGKTTTLAAMIDHRNRETKGHILTIEDPIEIVHPNHQSIVSQREVGADTADFSQALRRALRQDPDVILVGEIRDEETMRTALAAAETGHLVLATLHTIDAQETIMRVLDLFPSEAEQQARAMLAGALKGIVSQRLARTIDHKRTAVVEVLVSTSRIADCITNPEETGKIGEAISDGEYYGMQTFDQALIKLVMSGRIGEDEANHLTTSPQNFKLKLSAAKSQAELDARNTAQQQAMYAQQAAQQAPAAAPAAAPGMPGMMPPVAGQPAMQPPPMQQPPLAAPVPAPTAMQVPAQMPPPQMPPPQMPPPGMGMPAPAAMPVPGQQPPMPQAPPGMPGAA